MTPETFVKNFKKTEFEQKIALITDELSKKDCKNIDFLRGKLAAYKELTDNLTGWTFVQANNYFK